MVGSKTNWIVGRFYTLGALISLATTSCSDESPTQADEVGPKARAEYFVGSVEGTSAKLGVAVEGERLLLFLCGGADDLDDTIWAPGTVDDGGKLYVEPGALSVEAMLAGDAIEGTLTRPRGTSHFRVVRASAESMGLWQAQEADGRVGLVVTTPGESGEAQGVFRTIDLNFQVTPVMPIRPNDGRLVVRIPALDRTVSLTLAIP